MKTDVLVIGGGLSGLASAVRAVESGATVTLLEASGKLGGRAYSYPDTKTGDTIDNGQHVLLGCYHRTLEFLRTIQTEDLLRTQRVPHLNFFHPEKGFFRVRLRSIRSSLGLGLSLWQFRSFSLSERLRMLEVVKELRSWDEATKQRLVSLTVEQWLDRLGQSKEVQRSFWNPIAVSVMNEIPQRACALPYANALRLALLGSVADSAFLIPKVSLKELYVDRAVEFIKSKGGRIFLKTKATRILTKGDWVAGVELGNRKHFGASAYVAALPHQSLFRILPRAMQEERPFDALPRFQTSPIISVHLWFEKPFTNRAFVGLIGKRVQWVFNKRKISGSADGKPFYISAVISGAHEFVELSRNDLIWLALQDLQAAFPEMKRSRLIHAHVIKEKEATISATPEVETLRPSVDTPLRNLFLAGDWVDTGLPATIEGAVESGYKAADLALQVGKGG